MSQLISFIEDASNLLSLRIKYLNSLSVGVIRKTFDFLFALSYILT